MNTTAIPTSAASGTVLTSSLPEANNDTLFEVIKGKRVDKPIGLVENLISSLLAGLLGPFCREKQLGRVVVETMFSIPGSGNDRRPDVAFVSHRTWPMNRPVPRVNAWAIAPDLAVEVISPTDRTFDVMAKVQEYFNGGVLQVWQIYSNVEQVWIFDSPHSVRILTRSEELAGDPLLPGFRLKLAELFPLTEPAA